MNTNLKYTWIGVIACWVAFVGTGRGQQSIDVPLPERRVDSFHVSQQSMQTALSTLAGNAQIPIGLELAWQDPAVPLSRINVRIENGSAGDVLDALIAADPRYNWECTGDVIHVFPKAGRETILDVNLKSFYLDSTKPIRAIQASLMTAPEIQAKMRDLGVRPWTIESYPSNNTRAMATASPFLYEGDLRGILDEIVKDSRGHFWMTTRFGTRGQYFGISFS